MLAFIYWMHETILLFHVFHVFHVLHLGRTWRSVVNSWIGF
jgi:hypothetical protein